MLSLSPILAVLLAVAGTPQAEARTLVERAIQAQGGREALAQARVHWLEAKGTRDEGSAQVPFRGEGWSQPPLRANYHIRASLGGHEFNLRAVVDGHRVWVKLNEVLVDATDEKDLKDFLTYLHKEWVEGLLPLMTDSRLILTPAGKTTVEGRPAQGVKVTFRGQPDVFLYFDKERGLLVKSSYRDGTSLHETIWRDYRLVDPWKEDEELLHKAGLGVDGPALLDLLRKQTPSTARLRQVKEQVARLGAASFREREAAQRALIMLGPVARPLLEQAAAGRDLETARRAREILERIPAKKTDTLAAAAVRLLTRTRPAGAAAVLRAYLPAAEGDAAREIRWALAEMCPDRTRNPDLLRTLNQPGRRLYPRGLKLPMRYTTYADGKNDAEFEVLRVRFYNRFEDRIFAKP